jgi:acyl CoA:acetate/3-ketoacid CoA transferase alpha subunit
MKRANQYASAIQAELSKRPVGRSVEKDWQRVVNEIGERHLAEVPEGWMTVLQIAALLKKSREHVAHLVAEAMRRGSVSMKKFTIRTGTGTVIRQVAHYKPLKGKTL